MFQKLINFLVFIFVVPFLIVLLFYILIRKLFNKNWEIFSNAKDTSISNKASVVGIPFTNIKLNEALKMISEKIENGKKSSYYFLNPHAINLSKKDSDFYEILSSNKVNFPDGMGMKLAGIFEKYSLQDNLCGTDLYPNLMEVSQEKSFSIFFLGGSEDVVEKMVQNAKVSWPNLKIAGFHHGYFDKEKESDEIVNLINSTTPDILLVSFGMPIQEKWIDEYFSRINTKAAFATGGLFDFFSGTIQRAPLAWRQVGMEWAYRLFKEPKRMWKRYVIGNPLFLVHVLKDRYLSLK